MTAVTAEGEAVLPMPGGGLLYPRNDPEKVVTWMCDRFAHETKSAFHGR